MAKEKKDKRLSTQHYT